MSRFTEALCLTAAAVETILGCTSTAGLTRADVLVAPFLIGPYGVLGLLALRCPPHTATAWVLLAVVTVLPARGLSVAGLDSYHAEPQYRLVQRVDVLFVALAPWVVVAGVGLGLIVPGRKRRAA